MRHFYLILALWLTASATAWSAREIEPNNHWLQATLIDGNTPVEGTLDDEDDYFKLVIPETGKVDLVMDQFPEGANLTLEVLGFGKSETIPLLSRGSHNERRIDISFRAGNGVGYLHVAVDPTEKVCKDDWCLMRLTASGPYYLVKPGPTMPPTWNGQPIVPPPDYRIEITHPQMVRLAREKAAAESAVADLPLVNDPATGIRFRHHPGWQVRTYPRQRRIELAGPTGSDAAPVQIAVEVRHKRDYPGSSAELQLNLVEHDLLPFAAEIRQRGRIEVMKRPSPFLLALYSLSGSDRERTMARFQLVLDLGDNYYWLSYTSPTALYSTYLGNFSTVLKTFQAALTGPEPAAPEPSAGVGAPGKTD